MGLGCETDMQQTGMGRGDDLMVTDAIAVSQKQVIASVL